MSAPSLRWLTRLVLVVSLVTGCEPLPRSGARHARLPAHETEAPPSSPLSVVPVAAVTPMGWGMIERRVYRGVRRGVSAFRFGVADQDDAVAAAMERAWRAYRAAAEPIRDPEAWGKTIAVRVSLDALRHKRRDRVCLLASPDDAIDRHATGTPSPLDVAAEAERRALLRQHVSSWPPAERGLALLLLDGHAETVTAAARLYRAGEEARGEPGTMYPHKARLLLHARRHELEELA